ncbi:hypothetical protein D3C86_2230630 [compost metagenome]
MSADRIGMVDFQGVEVAFGQSDELAGVFHDVGFARPRGDGHFFVDRQFDVGRFDHGVDATNRLGVEGVA